MADNVAKQRTEAIKRIPCEVYSRIVGYLRPVQAWNEGKQQEFLERETYSMARCLAGEAEKAATQSVRDE
jgi:hypothetical protein